MPYKLRKAPNKPLYWVVNKETGKKHSKDPLPKARAEAQMRALYAVEKGYKLKGGDINDVGQAVADTIRNEVLPGVNKVIPGLGTVLQTVGDVGVGLFTDKDAIAAEQARQAADAASRQRIAEQYAATTEAAKTDPTAWQKVGALGFQGMGKRKRRIELAEDLEGKGKYKDILHEWYSDIVKDMSAYPANPPSSSELLKAHRIYTAARKKIKDIKGTAFLSKRVQLAKDAVANKMIDDLEAVKAEFLRRAGLDGEVGDARRLSRESIASASSSPEDPLLGEGKQSEMAQTLGHLSVAKQRLEHLRDLRYDADSDREHKYYNEFIQKVAKPTIKDIKKELKQQLKGFGKRHVQEIAKQYLDMMKIRDELERLQKKMAGLFKDVMDGDDDAVDEYEKLSKTYDDLADSLEKMNHNVLSMMRDQGKDEDPKKGEEDPTVGKGKHPLRDLLSPKLHHLIKKKIKGGGVIPSKDALQKIAEASYASAPAKVIDGLELIDMTPTLKFYKGRDNTIVVGIRGTDPTQKEDLLADGRISIGELEGSSRYKTDEAKLRQFQVQYSPSVYDYYGVGHSLGGAILDAFLKKGLLKSGVSYNPAVQVGDFKRALPNQRIYNEEDPLYQLMGKHTSGAEVRKERKKKWYEKAVEKVPYLGKAYKYYKAHQLDNFVGGAKATPESLKDIFASIEAVDMSKKADVLKPLEIWDEHFGENPITGKQFDWESPINYMCRRCHTCYTEGNIVSIQEATKKPMYEEDEYGRSMPQYTKFQCPICRDDWIEHPPLMFEIPKDVIAKLNRSFRASMSPLSSPKVGSGVFTDEMWNGMTREMGRFEATHRLLSLREKRHIDDVFDRAKQELLMFGPSTGDPAKEAVKQGIVNGAIANVRTYLGSLILPPRPPPIQTKLIPKFSKDAITADEIRDGDQMMTFQDEFKNRRFYKKSTYESLPTPKVNPFTREPITRGATPYIAKIDTQSRVRDIFASGKASKFAKQLEKEGIVPSSYLKMVRRKAKAAGYDPKKLDFAKDGVHKLSYDGIGFGRVGYGDHLIWMHSEKQGSIPKGTADDKKKRFQKSHLAMKGDWKKNDLSPNWLALRILW